MNPKWQVLIVALWLAAAARAQNISLGPRAGVGITDIVFRFDDALFQGSEMEDPNDFARISPGFLAGADVLIPIDGRFSMQAGACYARKGYRADQTAIDGSTQETEVQLQYFNFPIVADYRVWRGLSAQAGLEPGILSTAWYRTGDERTNVTDRDIYKRFDMGLAVGLEWRIGGFFVAGRQVWGILPVLELELVDANAMILGEVKGYNQSLSFSAGYRFSL